MVSWNFCQEICSSDRQNSYYPAVTAWGYQSMACGYGYTRGSSGYCEAQSWWQTTYGCYETTIIQRTPLIRARSRGLKDRDHRDHLVELLCPDHDRVS